MTAAATLTVAAMTTVRITMSMFAGVNSSEKVRRLNSRTITPENSSI